MNDILIDTDYAPIIVNGDFSTGGDLLQRQSLLWATSPGDWKKNPFTGIDAVNSINDESPETLIKRAKRQYKADGLKVKEMYFNNNELYTDAEES